MLTFKFIFRNGKSKGIAYIEFADEKAAKTAVIKMDNQEYMDRVLSVAISAPPAPSAARPAPQVFSGARKMVQKSDQKSRISFVPASVQKASAKETPAPSPGQPAMSNEDFRKMLLK